MPASSNLMDQIELTNGEYQKYCDLIYRVAGIRIAENKRVMVSNRVRRRLRATGIPTFAEYHIFLTSPAGSNEMPFFLDAITTNETYFFRDIQNYDWLADTFLPEVTRQGLRAKTAQKLGLWSAACSTGEEPYSIALKVLAKKQILAGWRITILGTDLSGAVLNAARTGTYDARAIRLVEPANRTAYFNRDPMAERWTVKSDVSSLVTWKRHNLLFPLREEPFDCIFLKNVLIYFDTESKQTVVKNVIDAMAKGGYLVIGPTEGIYTMLDSLTKHKTWLYQRPH